MPIVSASYPTGRNRRGSLVLFTVHGKRLTDLLLHGESAIHASTLLHSATYISYAMRFMKDARESKLGGERRWIGGRRSSLLQR